MDIAGACSSSDGNSTMVAVLVFLAAGTLAFCVMAIVRVQGSVRRRAANIGQVDDVERPAARARCGIRVSKAAQRLIEYTTKHYADRQQRRDQGAAPAHDPGRHLRSARGGLFLPRPHGAGGRAGGAGVPVRRRCTQGGSVHLAADRARRHRRLSGAEPLHRPPHQGAQGRAPGRLSRISWTCWWSAPTPG